MPYVQIRTNKNVSEEKQNIIKQRIGDSINILDKTEDWLMVEIVNNCNLFFKGNNNMPIALVDVSLYGKCDTSSYNSFTNNISNMLKEELDITPVNTYVKYSEYSNWGWNGNNF